MLSNFLCAFKTPFTVERHGWDESRDKVGFTFEYITCLPGRAKKGSQRCKPKLDAIAYAFANKIAFDMAGEAARRLSQLLKMRGEHEQGISLEHICMNSGKDSDLLQHLAAVSAYKLILVRDRVGHF